MPAYPPFPINKKTFPFLAQLYDSRPLIPIAEPVSVYATGHLPEAKNAMVYFAASMVWRAAIYPWNDDGSYPVKLGRFAEEFRCFLMDENPFPDNASLTVSVRAPSLIWKHAHAPVTEKHDGATAHRFLIPGFLFTLYVGGHLPEWARALDLAHAEHSPVFVGDFLENAIGHHASTLFRTSGGLPGFQERHRQRNLKERS